MGEFWGNFWWHWGNFGRILVQLGGNWNRTSQRALVVLLGEFWGNILVALGEFWGNFGEILGELEQHFPDSLGGTFGGILGEHFGGIVGILGEFWRTFGATVTALPRQPW